MAKKRKVGTETDKTENASSGVVGVKDPGGVTRLFGGTGDCTRGPCPDRERH